MAIRNLDTMLRSMRQDIRSLQRAMVTRRGRGTLPPLTLPDRLSETGAEVDDWDDAIQPGFYWGLAAANRPSPVDGYFAAEWFAGIVTWFPGSSTDTKPRILQEVREARSSMHAVVYRRYLQLETNGSVTVLADWVSQGYDTGWSDITANVTLAAGLSWSANGYFMARRIDDQVMLAMDGVSTDSAGFFNSNTSGNIANTPIITGIPSRYRPVSVASSLSPLSSGRVASYYVTSAGQVSVAAIAPNSDWTGTTPFPAGEPFSFTGTFFR